MKKLVQILIAFSILFFGINRVKAVENEIVTWQDTGTCTVTESTNDTCSYHCNMSIASFDYKAYIEANDLKFKVSNSILYDAASASSNSSVLNYVYNVLFLGNKISVAIAEKLDGVLFDAASPVTFDNDSTNPPRMYFINNGKLNCSPIVPVMNYKISSTSTLFAQFTVGPIYINQDSSYTPNIDSDLDGSGICGFLGSDTSQTVAILRKIYMYMKILIPVLIILLGIVDFVKVVVTGKDDDMKKALSRLVKRIIVAIVFILVPVIIQLFINISGLTSEYSGINDGLKAILCVLN